VLAICFIIFLACLKVLFKKLFPHSLVFHYNLLSAVQLLLLLWAILTGLMEGIWWKNQTPVRSRLKSFFCFLALMTLAEAGCVFLFHHPHSIPRPFIPVFRDYYNNYQRDILQYNKNISRYDAALFYRMKADNRSRFSNIEFDDSIRTDGAGFRTNIAAQNLENPGSPSPAKIICLGDSYTLGWGVQQNQTYPARLEQILKRPVLNTGMSSYGTIREIESIRNLDNSDVTTVVIQYCFNDAEENEAYVNNHLRLPISPQSVYDSAVDMLWWSNLYFPGKYFCTIAKLSLKHLTAPQAQPQRQQSSQPQQPPPPQPQSGDQASTYDQEASCFLTVLKNSGLDFDKIQLFVFDIREYQNLSGDFVRALGRQLSSRDNSRFFNGHLHVLSIDGLLTPADYYILDEHVRAVGQVKIAAFLAAEIRKVQP
jgi:hypothetical protein